MLGRMSATCSIVGGRQNEGERYAATAAPLDRYFTAQSCGVGVFPTVGNGGRAPGEGAVRHKIARRSAAFAAADLIVGTCAFPWGRSRRPRLPVAVQPARRIRGPAAAPVLVPPEGPVRNSANKNSIRGGLPWAVELGSGAR